jgi:predicted nucleic acid-binding protein
MIAPVFVDTNVLVYARDASAADKHARARAWMAHLWQAERGRLSFQVLHEYYVVTTRKLTPALSRTEARAEVRTLLAWQPQPVNDDLLESAWDVEDRFGLSFWDALVVSAAQAAGCRYLLTEDLQHGQELDNLTVLSPFRATPEEAD